MGFTTVSICYALWTNFYLGLLFIVFYSIPTLCSGIGSKRLDEITKEKSLANQVYVSQVTNMIAGARSIRYYRGQSLFYKLFSKDLHKALKEEIAYEEAGP